MAAIDLEYANATIWYFVDKCSFNKAIVDLEVSVPGIGQIFATARLDVTSKVSSGNRGLGICHSSGVSVAQLG